MSSLILSVQEAEVTLADKVIFENLTLNIQQGEKIALVGRNGAGKTTLMRVIGNNIDLDAGKRWEIPGLKIGYLQQEISFDENITVFEYLLSHLNPEYQTEDYYYMVDAVIEPLELDSKSLMGKLSGGQIRRVALASALLEEPDILLLDEPTNHLDLMAIEWLEIYLKSYRGAVVCVSHDKTFLANISNRIFWLDRGALKVCQKGFGYFDEWSNILFEQEARELHNREKILEGELEWANRGVKARVKRNQRRLALVKAERDKLKADTSAFKRATQTIELKEFGDNIETSSNIRAEFYNVHKSFVQDNVTKTILKGFSLRILKGDRIGILGRNGSGKSTFLKLLIDELKPDLGTIKRSKTLQISYFDQKRSDLKENVTIKEILCRGDGDYIEVAGKQRHVCGYLKDFMFDPKRVNDLVSNLSGGQQNRLLLAKVLAEPGNFMILDEPTNDLDMDTLDMLEELLSHYKGTLIIVSHDRDFLDQTVTKILAFEGDGKVELNIGGYSDYLEYKQSKTESGIKNNSPEINVNPKETQQQDKFKTLSKLSYKFQFELEQLPKKIAEKEEEIKILETLLSDSTLYTENSEKYNFATRKYQQAKKDLVRLEDRWIELEMMNNS